MISEKNKFVDEIIQSIVIEKDKIIQQSKNNTSYNPIIALTKLDQNIEKWVNLSDEEYNEIISFRNLEKEKEEEKDREFQENLKELKLTEVQFFNMSDEEFNRYLKKYQLIKDRKKKLQSLYDNTKELF